MLLDADNVVLDDPEYLFYATEYMQTGTLFWPDVTTLKPTNPLFETLELKPREVRAQESGQLLIDKKRCWKALNLSVHMNKESDYYYQYIYGDKDTFFLSCLATQTPYAMVNHLPGLVFRSAGGWPFSSFLQRDCQGRPLFCHTVLLNWSERVDFNTMWHYYTLPTQKSDVLYPEYNYKDTQYKSFRVKYKEHERKCIEFLKQVKSFDA
jgi:alpha 1,2-mannosyltransferase